MYKNKNMSLNCPSCPGNQSDVRDSQGHILLDCIAYDDLREDLVLTDDSDLATFFTKVVQRRIENGMA